MAKVITLSQRFPSYHPKKGQPTYFVEQVLNSLGIDWTSKEYIETLVELNWKSGKISKGDCTRFWNDLDRKYHGHPKKIHTIRSGSRFKEGDMASLRVWSGKPYNSPQIIIAPDVPIVKTYPLEIQDGSIYRGLPFSLEFPEIQTLAKNDGLSTDDLFDWFQVDKQDFDGQVIAWVDLRY